MTMQIILYDNSHSPPMVMSPWVDYVLDNFHSPPMVMPPWLDYVSDNFHSPHMVSYLIDKNNRIIMTLLV